MVIATIQVTVLTLFLAMLIAVSLKKKSFLVIISELQDAISKKLIQNCVNVSCNDLFCGRNKLPYIQVYIKSKKCRVGIWFFPLVVDWMQADLNCEFAVNFKKGAEFKRTK